MSIAESSYESAFGRLRQLGYDGSGDSTTKTPRISFGIESSQTVRLRELEELATVACAENMRLEGCVAQMRDENAAMRDENAALKLEITRLELRTLALAEKVPRPRAGLLAVAGAAFAAIVVAIIALRPQHAPPSFIVAAPPPVEAPAQKPPAPAPVQIVVPAPVVAPLPVEPESTVAMAEVEPTAKVRHVKHPKRVAKAASKKGVASAKKRHSSNNDDPLAGLAL